MSHSFAEIIRALNQDNILRLCTKYDFTRVPKNIWVFETIRSLATSEIQCGF